MRTNKFMQRIIILLFALMSASAYAENTNIEGYVKDSKTGEPLFGANVILVGTSMGAATDMYGKYIIKNVIEGSFTVRASYIGYKQHETKITVHPGKSQKLEFKLDAVSSELKDVVVTAQAAGQNAAINQQLASNQIVNVVSAAKIQELPDANAAESVGRLPGISVTRSGGEGNGVVIRGLAPKYNKITIEGVQMSSSNSYDRGTDLSMITSNILEGIQVSKTVTSDMDADVLGGTVNFELKEAKTTEPGKPEFHFLLQGAYNNLSNARNKLNNYKYQVSAENRFFEDNFGIFAQFDAERKNLSSNEMGASYTQPGDSYTDYITTGLGLNDISRDRRRYNGALVLDYKLTDGKIKLTNFVSSGNTDVVTRAEYYSVSGNTKSSSYGYSKSKLTTFSNTLSYQQQLPIFYIDAKLSNSYAETENPDTWSVGYLETSAGLDVINNERNPNPVNIPKFAKNNLNNTFLQSITTSSGYTNQRNFTGSLDLKTTLNFSDFVSAEVKFGGKYKYQKNYNNYDQYDQTGGGLTLGGSRFVDDMICTYFGLPTGSTQIPITHFLDKNFSFGDFLEGRYPMVANLSGGMMRSMVNLLKDNAEYIAKNNRPAYGHDDVASTTTDYFGKEEVTAFYLMSVINVGPLITIIPGVRFQGLRTEYNAPRGFFKITSYENYDHVDTTVVQNHDFWLPAVSLRYKPFDWFDIRMSYSNTISYPDYWAIIPKLHVSGNSISYNNFELKPSKSTNYDVYLSFYNNAIGLFTSGAFYKQVTDLIYGNTIRATGAAAAPYFPTSIISPDSKLNYVISTTSNNPYKGYVYGFEFDWQTHFWYLPDPLSGLVFSANYTRAYSETEYRYEVNAGTPRAPRYEFKTYTARMIYQPNDIVNLSMGYDYAGFSCRLSMLYQNDIFTGPNLREQLSTHTSAYTRWDLAVKQQLPWYGIQMFCNLNNINGSTDVSIISGGGVPTSEQDYGLLIDFGVRVKL